MLTLSLKISIVVITAFFADFWPENPNVHELSASKPLFKEGLEALSKSAVYKHAGRRFISVTPSSRIHIINYGRNTLRQILATSDQKNNDASNIDVNDHTFRQLCFTREAI